MHLFNTTILLPWIPKARVHRVMWTVNIHDRMTWRIWGVNGAAPHGASCY